MDDLAAIIDQIVYDRATRPPVSPAEAKARRALLEGLFVYFREIGASAPQRLDLYTRETEEIPFDKLALGIKAVLRSRVYADLPRIGDLWRAARTVAGMHREQYRAGHYLPAPTTWPPSGKRYGPTADEFDDLDLRDVPTIGPGDTVIARGF